MHQDNLGNIIAMSDSNGVITNRRSYTPFGEIRNILYTEIKDQANSMSTHQLMLKSLDSVNRGFTGHEHINGTDLIHMNGRVYDPTIGRFLSADPHIQAPNDTQSYNRYSYVKNNPINYTDPSGYFFKSLFKWVKNNWKTILAVAVSVAIGIYAPGIISNWIGSKLLGAAGSKFVGVVAAGALAGGASGAIMTGSVQGALEGAKWGAISAAAAFGVAEAVGAAMGGVDAHNATLIKAGQLSRAGFVKAIGHGLSRAAIAKARYGTGKGAFLSAFVSSGFSVGSDSKFGAIKMAIVGGTASVIGGGKSANGAMGSAFQYLFNDFVKANIDKNIELMKTVAKGSIGSARIHWVTLVKGGGKWDYKRIYGLSTAEDLGNFNYGATGAALNFSLETLSMAGGIVQIYSGTSKWNYIDSFFDDPRDQ